MNPLLVSETWQKLFDSIREYVFLVSPTDLKILDINPSATQLLDLSKSELIGRSFRHLLVESEEQAQRSNEQTLSALAGWRILRGKEGQEIPVLVSWVPIDEQHGYIIAREADDSRAAAVTLRMAEEWFRTTLYSVGDAVITTDVLGHVQQMNPAAEFLTGWQEKQAAGKPIEKVFHIVNEHTRKKVENPVGRVLREGIVVGLANHTLLISKDGKEYPIADSGAPIRNDQGEIVGVVLVFRDQTQERQAQNEIEKAKQFAEAIVETAREPLLVLDAELRVISANRAFFRLFQVEPKETLGRFLYELGNHQWDIPELRQLLEDILPQNTKFDDFEVEHEFENLGRRIMQLNARRIYSETGKTQFILLAIEDITSRKQAERAMQANEKHYRLLFDSNPLPMWVYDLETLGFLMVNDAAVKKYGYSREEFLSMNLRDIRPAEDVTRLLDDVAETVDELNFAGEWRHCKKDGTVFPVEIISHTIEFHGRAARLVVAIDQTERKRAEESLRESEERYQIVSDMISDYAYAFEVGEDGALTLEWIAGGFENITGFTPQESEKRGGWAMLIYPPDMPIAIERAKRLMAGDRDVSEFRIVRKDGKVRWLRDHGYAQWDERLQRVVRIYGAAQDITERKHRELELEALAQIGEALGETIELDNLLEAFIQAALHAVPAAQKGSLALIADENHLRVRSQVGYSDSVVGFTYSVDWGYAGRSFRERKTLLVEDIEQDAELRRNGAAASLNEVRGIRSAVVAPLLAQGQAIGVISLESDQPGVFELEDLGSLERLASTLALVIQNARLFEDVRHEAEKNSALLVTSQAAATVELNDLLNTVGERLIELFRADSCLVYLLEEDKKTLRCVLAMHPEGEYILGTRIETGRGIAGFVAESGEAEVVNDMIADPRSIHIPGTEDEPEAMMFAPLKAKGEKIGVMSLARSGRERPFTCDDLELFQAVASQIAIAILNAQLYDETRRRLSLLESLQRVSNALRAAQSFEEALPIALDEILAIFNTDSGMVRLYDPVKEQFIVHLARGWLTQVAPLPITKEEGLAGEVIRTQKLYIVEDFVTEPLVPAQFRAYIPEGWSGVAVPILTEAVPLGVLIVALPHPRVISLEEQRLLSSLADMLGTALQRLRLHEETVKRVEQLQALQTVDKAITATLDIHVMLGVLVQQAAVQLKSDAVGILLYSPILQTLEYAAARGFRTHEYERSSLGLHDSLAGKAVIERQPVIVTDIRPEAGKFSHLLTIEGFQSYIAVPLIAKGQIKGVLESFYRSLFVPDEDWLAMFEMLAGQAAIAIDNAQMFEELQRANLRLALSYDATIEGWSKTLEMRDKETEGHTQRVTNLTLQLAQRLGVDSAMIAHIRRGCILHDIGKIAISDAVLLKPGPLTEEEWLVIKTHPSIAYELLSGIEYLRPALDIPYSHHERWDGSGYPRGLRGEGIPLPARIFAVADVWDALTNDRPYRKAWSEEEALEYLKDQAGKQFDPRVVAEFLKLINEETSQKFGKKST